MKSFKKSFRPILTVIEVVSAVGAILSLLGKKKSYAGIFAAVGAIAFAASYFLNKKEKAEKQAEEEWNAENFMDGLSFDDIFPVVDDQEDEQEEDIPLKVEEELAKDDCCDLSQDELSQAIKNLEDAGKALEDALDGLESDSLKEME